MRQTAKTLSTKETQVPIDHENSTKWQAKEDENGVFTKKRRTKPGCFGRPTVPPFQKRDQKLRCFLTSSHHRHSKETAARLNLSLSRFLAGVALGVPVIPKPVLNLQACHELKRSQGNLEVIRLALIQGKLDPFSPAILRGLNQTLGDLEAFLRQEKGTQSIHPFVPSVDSEKGPRLRVFLYLTQRERDGILGLARGEAVSGSRFIETSARKFEGLLVRSISENQWQRLNLLGYHLNAMVLQIKQGQRFEVDQGLLAELRDLCSEIQKDLDHGD